MILIDTPNPNAKKIEINHNFQVGKNLEKDKLELDSVEFQIINIESVESIFVGPDFLTILKTENSNWDLISDEINTILDKI